MVLIPVALSGAFLWAFATELSWIFFTYFWLMFPAFGLLVRGVAGLYDSPDEPTASNSKGRELLGGPARARGVDVGAGGDGDVALGGGGGRYAKELAEGGHLDVRVRGALLRPLGAGRRGHQRELEGRG